MQFRKPANRDAGTADWTDLTARVPGNHSTIDLSAFFNCSLPNVVVFFFISFSNQSKKDEVQTGGDKVSTDCSEISPKLVIHP